MVSLHTLYLQYRKNIENIRKNPEISKTSMLALEMHDSNFDLRDLQK
jgi:hypothetical protein